MMFITPAVVLAKIVSVVSVILGLGAGATWPGEIALRLYPNILRHFFHQLHRGVIIIAGTNGKTTTSLMVTKILESQGYSVVHNASGANLVNGIVSAFIRHSRWGKINKDWGVFEVDENALGIVMTNVNGQMINKRAILVLLNLFRDQLDRYGEVDIIAQKWSEVLVSLRPTATKATGNRKSTHDSGNQYIKIDQVQLILNADDPAIAFLGQKWPDEQTIYFGVNNPLLFLKDAEHATDSTFCPVCGSRLRYDGIYFSHIGIWSCPRCGIKRPTPKITYAKSTLKGLYNTYNALAASAVARVIGLSQDKIVSALTTFVPAFGRQEEFRKDGRTIKLFLSKNPAGFNASLRTVLELSGRHFLLLLNDRIPDGRDVSWIWDVDFEILPDDSVITVGGDRVYDMALRVQYARSKKSQSQNFLIEPDLKKSIWRAVERTPKGQTLFILPTYSAMLEVRKILTGRKIL